MAVSRAMCDKAGRTGRPGGGPALRGWIRRLARSRATALRLQAAGLIGLVLGGLAREPGEEVPDALLAACLALILLGTLIHARRAARTRRVARRAHARLQWRQAAPRRVDAA